MPRFSNRSKNILSTCDPQLVFLFNEVVKDFDCTVFSGRRGQEEQDELVRQSKSQIKFPLSQHNSNPSMAVDVAAYPIHWADRERATYFAGFVMGVASENQIHIRWGGDWNSNTLLSDNLFDDLFHFELED